MKHFFSLSFLCMIMVVSTSIQAQTKYDTNDGKGSVTIDESQTTLTADQQKMLDEINLVRTNPKAYIPHIEAEAASRLASFPAEYAKADAATKKAMDEWKVDFDNNIAGLKKLLNEMKPVSKLEFSPCILKVAQAHAIDQTKILTNPWVPVDHNDSKGKGPAHRIGSTCSDFPGGGENLEWEVFAPHMPVDARRSNSRLLIDQGVPSRGHRTTILHRDFTHCAPYNYQPTYEGTTMNVWIQNFSAHKSYVPPAPTTLPAGCPTSASSISWHSGLQVDGKVVSQDCFDYWKAKLN